MATPGTVPGAVPGQGHGHGAWLLPGEFAVARYPLRADSLDEPLQVVAVASGVRSEGDGVRVRVIFFDRDDATRAAGAPVMTAPLIGDGDWTDITTEFTVPERTGRVQFELMHWLAAGDSWWREPTLERVGKTP